MYKKRLPLESLFLVEQKEQNSNFLVCIKELILQLKESETVLMLEKFRLIKMAS